MTAKKSTVAPKEPVANHAPKVELPTSIRIAVGQATAMPASIAKGIIAIQRELKPLVKTAENTEFNSSFVPLSDVFTTVIALLGKHNMGTTQWPVTKEDKSYLVTVLFHEDGSSITGELELLMTGKNAQALGSAITYDRRYGIMAVLGMVGEDDDDGNKAAGRMVKPSDMQIAEIKQLAGDLKFPAEEIEKRILTLRTADHAEVAINNLHELIAKRVKVIKGEANPIPVFTGDRDEIAKPRGRASIVDDARVDQLQSRIVNLQLPDSVRPKFIAKFTGKPFAKLCTPDELDRLEAEIKRLEDLQTDGIVPVEDIA